VKKLTPFWQESNISQKGVFYMGTAVEKKFIKEMIKENQFQNVGDIYSYFKDLFKDTIQEMLEAELDVSIGYPKNEKLIETDNERNGYSQKTVKSQFGEFELDIPRDRKGDFEPKIVPKYKRDISGLEEKIISLYSRGMSTRDIHDQIKDLYGIEVSAEMVSKITERLVPEIKEWQSRALDPIYPFIFMDAIHYKVREDGHILNKAAYVVLGIDLDGNKDILGVWIGGNESSKFWLGVLTELKNRGVQEVLIFSVDGLSGLKEAIQTAYPKAEIQRCIIHQLRNSFKYVSYKHLKEFASFTFALSSLALSLVIFSLFIKLIFLSSLIFKLFYL
jgi:putative transposase